MISAKKKWLSVNPVGEGINGSESVRSVEFPFHNLNPLLGPFVDREFEPKIRMCATGVPGWGGLSAKGISIHFSALLWTENLSRKYACTLQGFLLMVLEHILDDEKTPEIIRLECYLLDI